MYFRFILIQTVFLEQHINYSSISLSFNQPMHIVFAIFSLDYPYELSPYHSYDKSALNFHIL